MANPGKDAVTKTLAEESRAITQRDFGVEDVQEEEAQQKVISALKEAESKAAKELEYAKQKSDYDARERLEQARLQHEFEQRLQEALLDEFQRKREAENEARQKEQAHQAKLQKMGFPAYLSTSMSILDAAA
ncbi:ATPase AAA-type core [Penicillium nucicola]|uniref:ATPase AAA-type core n=1 Tax=Penicillium nucicola TaxID=1850975 RepID=UPI00254592EE|nr:ATPase AAA-type core [Penicillium nucicola]KAJ5769991.1 ATPase AAA-type core [Penicillium nucicola]